MALDKRRINVFFKILILWTFSFEVVCIHDSIVNI